MCEPLAYKTREEAEELVKAGIAQVIRDNDDLLDEMETSGIDIDNDEAVTAWADDNDYLMTYNCDFPDTLAVGDDWIEYRIDEVEVDA